MPAIMPSIFRTTPKKDHHAVNKSFTVPSRGKAAVSVHSPSGRPDHLTEFGRLEQVHTPLRSRPTSHASDIAVPSSSGSPPPLLPPKYSFAPTRIPSLTSANSIDSFAYSQDEMTKPRHYGPLGGVGAKVTLSLVEVGRVIEVVGKELERQGLTTPLLFSNQALELNPTRVRSLIQSYLDSVRSSSTIRREAWARDLAYAKEHDLAWMLRWALSRIVRVKEGTGEVCHGLLEWEVYEEWRGRERAASYPHNAFPYLSALIPSEVYHVVLLPFLRLLSRFAAYSHLSSLTPHSLSSLFAPFMFDIPTSSTSMNAHMAFIRATYATEHILLAYIRSLDQGEGLGVTDLPSRLKDWVSGYPSMVASDADLARAVPRRGARIVRCERASRLVRAYSKDLIASAETWAKDVEGWEAWDRVVLKIRRGEGSRPRFSKGYKRRLLVKDILPLPGSSSSDGEFAYGRARRPIRSNDKHDRMKPAEEGDEMVWGSLAGKEWSMFEQEGFDSPSLSGKQDDSKSRLQFDLNESAKLSVAERRRTMEWSEFAAPSGGFTRTDTVLDVSLTFAPPISSSINEWPKEREDLNKRLHKTQKEATPFSYDTTPRIGNDIHDSLARPDQYGRVYVEEAFVDWWADWAIGGGWMDWDELTFKEANWALIEYKARPSRSDNTSKDPLADPRTSEMYFLFEEKVPLEYQLAVADPKEKRTFASLFNSRKKRANHSPSKTRIGSGLDESDFDQMLLYREKTKKLTLSRSEPPHSSVWQMATEATSPIRTSVPSPTKPTGRARAKSNGDGDPHVVEGKASFFSKNRDKAVRRVKSKTEEGGRGKTRIQPANEVEFEIHSASGVSSPDTSPRDGSKKEDDKWMDILIANGARKMERHDALPPRFPPGASSVPPIPGGLPVSPHPPARHPSPTPPWPPEAGAKVSQNSTGQLDPYAQYNNPVPADYSHRSPETSGSDAEGVVTPPEVDIQRWPSGKRKPVPPISPDEGVHELHDGIDYDDPHVSAGGQSTSAPGGRLRVGEGPIPPTKDRPSSGKILQPSPRRDTIHNIVETYRDSMMTVSSDLDSSELSSKNDQEAEYASRFTEDELVPPPKIGGPVFDLTPGREPSPARYKHGEPLHFVGEEEEEEEY